jgi:hypothetical protein
VKVAATNRPNRQDKETSAQWCAANLRESESFSLSKIAIIKGAPALDRRNIVGIKLAAKLWGHETKQTHVDPCVQPNEQEGVK